ncbi:MAG TPA: hypothetical protein VF420_07800 [Casimicrobiaceae bacterium]
MTLLQLTPLLLQVPLVVHVGLGLKLSKHAVPFLGPAAVHLPGVAAQPELSVQAFCEQFATPGTALQSDFFVHGVVLSWQVEVWHFPPVNGHCAAD